MYSKEDLGIFVLVESVNSMQSYETERTPIHFPINHIRAEVSEESK